MTPERQTPNWAQNAENVLAVAPQLRLDRILVPIDFSEGSASVLRYALAFAEEFQAVLILQHVIELYPVDYLLGRRSSVEANAWLGTQARQRLEALSRKYAEANGVRVQTVVTFGRPFHEIAQLAHAHGADLIILGARDFGGLKHFPIGSTAERVLRHAPCPVLVVREPERQSEQS